MNGSDRHSLAEPNLNPYASPQVEGLTAATPKADWSPPAGPLTDGIRVSGALNWQDFKRSQKLHFGIEEGVQSNPPESSHTMRWTFFTKHRRSADMLLLYWDPPLTFWFFPRRQFENDADWQAALELIARKVPAG